MGITGEEYKVFLQLNPITTGYVLITANLVWLKMENPEPILTAKRVEQRKFIDYFGLSIEAEPSRAKKKNVCFSVLGPYQSLNMEHPHIERYQM